MKQLGMHAEESQLDRLMRAADLDQDGTVSYKEFVNLLLDEKSS